MRECCCEISCCEASQHLRRRKGGIQARRVALACAHQRANISSFTWKQPEEITIQAFLLVRFLSFHHGKVMWGRGSSPSSNITKEFLMNQLI